MKKRILALALVAAASAFPPAAVAAPAEPAPIDAQQAVAEIDRQMTEAAAEGFGGAVVIEQGGKMLLAKGYGFADRERKVPFTPDTVAQIGSITKSQTAAALATLIAEGRVALSDPLSKFVPEAREPGRSRTVAQLVKIRSRGAGARPLTHRRAACLAQLGATRQLHRRFRRAVGGDAGWRLPCASAGTRAGRG